MFHTCHAQWDVWGVKIGEKIVIKLIFPRQNVMAACHDLRQEITIGCGAATRLFGAAVTLCTRSRGRACPSQNGGCRHTSTYCRLLRRTCYRLAIDLLLRVARGPCWARSTKARLREPEMGGYKQQQGDLSMRRWSRIELIQDYRLNLEYCTLLAN